MKKRIKLIIWPIVYLVLIINVCFSFILVFRSYYYRSIFVHGISMEPTLNGELSGRSDYGIIDDHTSAINAIKRFQIITTYYPFTDSDYVGGYVHGQTNVVDEVNSSYKIKRVYGLPGETIRFDVDLDKYETIKGCSTQEAFTEPVQKIAQECIKFYVKKTGDLNFVEQKITFKRKIDVKKIPNYANFEFELQSDEYWVMGDNYSASSDCFNRNPKHPIYKDNIVGVLIAIEGTCKIEGSTDKNLDGTKSSYRCLQRKRYLVPKFF